MFKKFKKIRECEKGFTLTEVMIGIMILTIAVVSSTSLLVGLIRSNEDNVKTLQAYFFAVEGIEAVRNIRDTNWLHNVDWMGESNGPFGEKFDIDENSKYGINLNFPSGATNPENIDYENLNQHSPWTLSGSEEKIYFVDSDEPTGFVRTISILPYECGESIAGACDDYVRVQSKVTWGENNKVVLEEILTNWKGGAL